jgi:glucose/arabinose dehydrogenase
MKTLSAILLCGIFVPLISAQYSIAPAYPNLPKFIQPLEFQVDGSTNRIFVIEQKGKIYLFQNDPSVNTRKVFLDLSGVVSQPGPGGETGLLGIAFHPNFKSNGYFYVNYTSSPGGQLTSFISRFQVNSTNPDTVLNATEQILITLPQPYANHNGGHLVFGPDGYLCASFGDGGSGGDPQNRAQNRDSLFGKILRLDVDHEADGKHYAIPSDNPYANNTQGFRQEIYAYGIRNIWKFSFDHVTGRLWAADVGQALYEEIDTISNGGNYGWNRMEGFHCYPSGNFSCDSTGFIPPLWEYPHINSQGNATGDIAIVGGFVYRGTTIPSLIGKYIYGDYGSGRIWVLTYEGKSPATNQLLVDKQTTSLNLSSFGEDQNHEVYTVGYSDGKIYKLVSSEKGSVGDRKSVLLSLEANIPNPFTQTTTIVYSLPEFGFAKLSLYDQLGKEVTKIIDITQEPGSHSFNFDGSQLPTGSYTLRLESNGKVISKKIIKE